MYTFLNFICFWRRRYNYRGEQSTLIQFLGKSFHFLDKFSSPAHATQTETERKTADPNALSNGSSTTNQNLTLPTEKRFTTAFEDVLRSEEPSTIRNEYHNNLIHLPEIVSDLRIF